MWFMRWYRRLTPSEEYSVGGMSCPGGFDIEIAFPDSREPLIFRLRKEEYREPEEYPLDVPIIVGYVGTLVFMMYFSLWWALPAFLYIANNGQSRRVFRRFGKEWH